MKNQWLRSLCLIFILHACVACATEKLNLTVLHTNDLHGMMLPFKYQTKGNMGGLARRSTLISRIRAETKDPVVLVDAGDIFTRGPWHKKYYGTPEVEAMNLMKYDLLTVGNNEFKATPDVKSQRIFLSLLKKSRFPWLAANLTDARTKLPVEGIHPYIIKTYGPVRVGFLGLTAPRSSKYPQTKGWIISDPIETARKTVPILRKECDIVIAVTHIGVEEDPISKTGALDKELASQVPGIDAIVGGDSHTYLSKPLEIKAPDGRIVPIVQAGEQGVWLGKFELSFEKKENQWRLKKFNEELIPLDQSIPEDPAMQKYLKETLKITEPLTFYVIIEPAMAA